MNRTTQITALLEARIRRGDYSAASFPAERDLARETGAARMTVRKAIDYLVSHHVLIRRPNGRLAVRRKRDGKAAVLRVGLLVPSLFSPDIEAWFCDLQQAAAKFKASVCPMFYYDWESPAVRAALQGLDGVFLVSRPEPMPEKVRRLLRQPTHPVVSLDRDLTAWDLPSIDAFPLRFVRQLLDHLYDLGHRQIDCVNAQTLCPVIAARIAEWRAWCRERRVTGRLLDESPETVAGAGGPNWRSEVAEGRFPATAMVATSLPAGLLAARTFRDSGWTVGRDISLAVINGENMAELQTPSLTCLRRPATGPQLETCLEWMARGGQRWLGPRLLQVQQVPLFLGESTGPVERKSVGSGQWAVNKSEAPGGRASSRAAAGSVVPAVQ